MAVTAHSSPEAGGAPRHVRSPAWRYLASLPVDRRLYREDIAGSMAHVEMLAATGIVRKEDADALLGGLRRVCSEIESGEFAWREDLEDVHTNVEVRLTEVLGPVGARVHTARSRNDQVALDERLYLREAVHAVHEEILRMQNALLEIAALHTGTVMPGYTHLQRAQPITLAHHMLAHFWRLSRDFERLTDCFARANVSPLGAGALAGSTLPIDPAHVARRLRFTAAFDNSLDAVSDRDYFAEFLFDLSLLAVHLSGLGTELVLWASSEFGFVRPSSALGSGSSLMPQKRNPDVAELARAKASRIAGDLMSLLGALRSLPLAYNRDLQEDKGAAFDAVQQSLETLEALTTALPTLEFDTARMADAAKDPALLATDLVEHLVSQGVPFREAHEILAGHLASGGTLDAGALRSLRPEFTAIEGLLDVRAAVARRRSPGGPAPEAVATQLVHAREVMARERLTLTEHADAVRVVEEILKEGPR